MQAKTSTLLKTHAALWLSLFVGAAHGGDLSRQTLSQAADDISPKMVKWRRHLHENPELSNQEVKTAAYIAKHLRSLKFDQVKEGVAKTGVVGVLVGGKPGPVVALRADMDALPVVERTGLAFASKVKGEFKNREVGVMHACGHDAHMAILMAVAEVFAKHRDEIPGTIKFIFQPAEEGMEGIDSWGAKQMVEEGVLEGKYAPEAIFGLHVFPYKSGTIGYRAKGMLAAQDRFELTIQGKQTHGSAPWTGVDPVTASAQVISAIQLITSRQLNTTIAPAVISVGAIHGGLRNNIIPDKVEMEGTIRTFDPAMRDSLHKHLHTTVEKTAEASGATAKLKIVPGYPVTYNDPALTAQMLPSLEAATNNQVTVVNPITGAEDFSYFQQKIPGLFVGLGVSKGEGQAYNHSPLFDIDEKALPVGVRTLSYLVWDYLQAKQPSQK